MKIIGNAGRGYDCNDGEIFEEIGEILSICYWCFEYGENIKEREYRIREI